MSLYETYDRYFKQFNPILRDMARRGLPIDNTRRLELKATIESEKIRVDEAIKALVPRECLGTAKALKRVPKDLGGFTEVEVIIEKEEKCVCLKKVRGSCAICVGTGTIAPGLILKRWAKVVEFNPNSSQQVKKFIKHLKHPVPKHAKRTDAQTGEAAETTEVKELQRLYAKTKHPIYPLLIEKRQLSKIEGTYVDGWQPGKDSRIHTTFTFKPATWQTSSRAPNIQNGLKHGKSPFQKQLANSFNAMQRSEPGHVMVNVDAKSFHAQTTACEAGLADYLRLAKIDIHSFVTCHYIKHPERHNLLALPDAELMGFFKQQKKDPAFKEIRDVKAKRTILGIQFAMFWRKLYQLNPEDFNGESEARKLWELIMVDLFPGLGVWQREVRRKAAEDGFLQNRYGAIRRFYDIERWDRKQQKMVSGEQAEAAVAFLPASSAFGYMRDVMLKLRDMGWDERYQLVNSIHDSLVFHCPVLLVDECCSLVTSEISKPSEILRYPICPDGLSVEAEASYGPDLANMTEWRG